MKKLSVYMPGDWDEEALSFLRERLDANAIVHSGPEPPDPADYRVLVK